MKTVDVQTTADVDIETGATVDIYGGPGNGWVLVDDTYVRILKMPSPEFGTAFSAPYEYYASQSGLSPKYSYTKGQHEMRFFQNNSGLSGWESLPVTQRATWRAQSGLAPVDAYTDTEHFNAYYAQVDAAIRTLLIEEAYRERELVNLAPNPSFERVTTGTTIIQRNLATNPRAVATSGITEVRRNLASYTTGTNSGPLTDTLGIHTGRWFGTGGGAGTHTLVTGATDGPIPTITQYLRKTWTVAPTINGDTGFNISHAGSTVGPNTNGFAVQAGATYTFSAWLRSSSGNKVAPGFDLFFRNAAGEYVTRVNVGVTTLEAGQWQRISGTVTVPANIATVGVVLDVDGGTPWAVGDTLDGTGLLVEQSPLLGDYFDGSYSPDPDLTTNWAGTVNGSQSALRGQAVAGNVSPIAQTIAYQHTEDGRKMMRYRLRTTGAIGINITDVLPTPGVNTTLLFKVRPVSRETRALPRIRDARPAGPGTVFPVGVWSEVRITLPAGLSTTTGLLLNSLAGHQYDDIIDISDIVVTYGPYVGPYFDGSTVDNTGIVYAWEGTANNSTSVAKAAVVEVRRNLALRPQPEGGSWGLDPGTGGAVTGTFENGLVKATWTTPATGGNPRIGPTASALIPVTAGDTLAVSIDAAASAQVTLLFDWSLDGSYVSLTNTANLSVSNNTATPTRISNVVSVPAGVNGMRVFVRWPNVASTQSGGWIAAGRLLIEKMPLVLPYFDGSTTPDGDLTPFWSGTVNNSQSVLSGTSLSMPTYGGSTVRSYNWASTTGNASVRYISKASNATTEAMFFALGGFGNTVYMKPGKTYTVMVKVHIDAPLPATSGSTLSMWVRWAGGTNGASTKSQAPNEAGTHILRTVANIPENVTGTMVQCNHYAPAGGGDSYWDDLIIVEGEYTGEYFDGNMPNVLWRGAINNSASHTFKV